MPLEKVFFFPRRTSCFLFFHGRLWSFDWSNFICPSVECPFGPGSNFSHVSSVDFVFSWPTSSFTSSRYLQLVLLKFDLNQCAPTIFYFSITRILYLSLLTLFFYLIRNLSSQWGEFFLPAGVPPYTWNKGPNHIPWTTRGPTYIPINLNSL